MYWGDQRVSIVDITDLCQKYGITFQATAGEYSTIYKFGPIGWAVTVGREFTASMFFEVAQRLAARFPEKSTGESYDNK